MLSQPPLDQGAEVADADIARSRSQSLLRTFHSRKLIRLCSSRNGEPPTPKESVIVRDLVKTSLPFVDLPWIGGAFTSPESHSPESAAAIKVSDDLVAELKSADRIVIGTPMYNFAVPAALKAYIDHIVRVGVTVSADNKGLRRQIC